MAAISYPGVPSAALVEAEPDQQNGGQAQLPQYVPLPREGQVEFYSGLRRGALNQLILPAECNGHKPPVRSISLKKPGLTKGKRLVVLRGRFAGGQLGLLDYLDSIRDEQTFDVAAQPTGGQ